MTYLQVDTYKEMPFFKVSQRHFPTESENSQLSCRPNSLQNKWPYGSICLHIHTQKNPELHEIFFTLKFCLCTVSRKKKKIGQWQYKLCTERRLWRYSANAMCIAGTSISSWACQVSAEVSAVCCCLFLFLFMLQLCNHSVLLLDIHRS